MIGEQGNVDASDQEMIENNNTVRNERGIFFLDIPSTCHEDL